MELWSLHRKHPQNQNFCFHLCTYIYENFSITSAKRCFLPLHSTVESAHNIVNDFERDSLWKNKWQMNNEPVVLEFKTGFLSLSIYFCWLFIKHTFTVYRSVMKKNWVHGRHVVRLVNYANQRSSIITMIKRLMRTILLISYAKGKLNSWVFGHLSWH